MGEPQAVVVDLPGWRKRVAAALTVTTDPDEYDRRTDARVLDAVNAWEEKVPERFRHSCAEHPGVLSWVRRYAEDRLSCPSLFLCGKVGTGKTWEAYGALRAVAESGTRAYAWQATTVADLFSSLRAKPFAQSEAMLASLGKAPLLLLDDLGAAHLTDWTEEVISRLIDDRYRHCAPTLFTSNYPLSALGQVVGERVESRMTQMVGEMQIPLNGADRRRAGGR